MTTCAVIICGYTFDRWDVMNEAIASELAQHPPPDDFIVVVDNNPELQARLAERFPDVRVVANHNERGVSGARNAGVELTTGDVVIFLDDDAVAQPGWLAGLAANYSDPRVLGVGGRLDPGWETDRPAWWPSEFDWVIGCSYTGQNNGVVRNIIGANSSFRRELFADGGFTSGIGRDTGLSLPVGCEETEFCIRAGMAKPDGVFLYDDRPTAVHSVPAKRESFSYFRSRCYSEGLSKAQVTGSVGVGSGLAAERTYTRVTLPAGVLRGIGQTFHGDVSGLLRAGAIIVGLAFTTAGYIVGSVAQRWAQLRGNR